MAASIAAVAVIGDARGSAAQRESVVTWSEHHSDTAGQAELDPGTVHTKGKRWNNTLHSSGGETMCMEDFLSSATD